MPKVTRHPCRSPRSTPSSCTTSLRIRPRLLNKKFDRHARWSRTASLLQGESVPPLYRQLFLAPRLIKLRQGLTGLFEVAMRKHGHLVLARDQLLMSFLKEDLGFRILLEPNFSPARAGSCSKNPPLPGVFSRQQRQSFPQ